MRFARLFHSPWQATGLGLATVAMAFALGGWTAAVGMALGLAATAFDVVALWWAVRFATRSTSEPAAAKLGAALVVVAFFAKLPIFVLCVFAAKRIDGWAQPSFGIAILLVYSALVAWSLHKGRVPAE